jgi:DNA repair exonuclease SbcCD ATPase subunit
MKVILKKIYFKVKDDSKKPTSIFFPSGTVIHSCRFDSFDNIKNEMNVSIYYSYKDVNKPESVDFYLFGSTTVSGIYTEFQGDNIQIIKTSRDFILVSESKVPVFKTMHIDENHDELTKRLNSKDGKIGMMKHDIERKDEEIKVQSKAMDSMSKQIIELNNEMECWRNRADNYLREKSRLEADNQSLRNAIRIRAENLEKIKITCDGYFEENQKLKDELRSCRNQSEKNLQERSRIESELQILQKEFDRYKMENPPCIDPGFKQNQKIELSGIETKYFSMVPNPTPTPAPDISNELKVITDFNIEKSGFDIENDETTGSVNTFNRLKELEEENEKLKRDLDNCKYWNSKKDTKIAVMETNFQTQSELVHEQDRIIRKEQEEFNLKISQLQNENNKLKMQIESHQLIEDKRIKHYQQKAKRAGKMIAKLMNQLGSKDIGKINDPDFFTFSCNEIRTLKEEIERQNGYLILKDSTINRLKNQKTHLGKKVNDLMVIISKMKDEIIQLRNDGSDEHLDARMWKHKFEELEKRFENQKNNLTILSDAYQLLQTGILDKHSANKKNDPFQVIEILKGQLEFKDQAIKKLKGRVDHRGKVIENLERSRKKIIEKKEIFRTELNSLLGEHASLKEKFKSNSIKSTRVHNMICDLLRDYRHSSQVREQFKSIIDLSAEIKEFDF